MDKLRFSASHPILMTYGERTLTIDIASVPIEAPVDPGMVISREQRHAGVLTARHVADGWVGFEDSLFREQRCEGPLWRTPQLATFLAEVVQQR